MEHWKNTYKPSEDELSRQLDHNRRVHIKQSLVARFNEAQKRQWGIATRTARIEKTQRRNEKFGTMNICASLRPNTATRLNAVAKGLKSANIECVLNRGFLFHHLISMIEELGSEVMILESQIKILKERNGVIDE